MADNAVQQERLSQLRVQQRTWLRHQQTLLDVRRTTADNERVLQVFNRTALSRKQLMDSMRSSLKDIESSENILLAERTAEQESLHFWTATILLLGGVVSVALAGYLSSVVVRHTRQLSAANHKLEEEAVERKRAAHALRESERRFRAIFNNAFQFSGLLSPDGTVLEVNQTLLDFGGFAREDVVGRPFWEARWWSLSSDTQEQLRAAIRHAAYGGFVRYEVEVRGANDSIAIIDFSLKPVSNEAGEVVLLLPEGRDITESRRSQEALRYAQERLRGIYESSRDAIVYSTLEGNLLDFNSSYCDLTGYSRDELMQISWQEITPPEYSRSEAEIVGHTIATGESAVYEKEYIRKDGSRVPVEMTAFLVRDADNHPQGLAAFAKDITERRQAQEALQQTIAGLQRSNTELEEFAYVASHDLQEPLRAVGGCVQVLQRRYKDKLDDRADELITHAVEGASRMQNLINDLLAYSRVGTRGKPFSPVDCNQLVADTLRSLQISIRESSAQVEVKDLPTVMADRGQLEQVFQNLIANAIKFRGEAVPKVLIDARKTDGDWLFAVRDNGIGIEPQYFERIFVMFQRLHTRTEYSGTGIGLAICKKVVERHGGQIWIESEKDQGTTFYFTIPHREQSNTAIGAQSKLNGI
jgi:PAS domain S-box-containing protein